MHAVYPVSSENLVNRFWQMKQFHSEFINLLLLVIPLEFQHLCVPFDYRADTVKKKTKTLNANFPPHKSHFTWRAAREDMNCPGCTLVSGQSFYTDLGRLNSWLSWQLSELMAAERNQFCSQSSFLCCSLLIPTSSTSAGKDPTETNLPPRVQKELKRKCGWLFASFAAMWSPVFLGMFSVKSLEVNQTCFAMLGSS